MAYDFDKIVYLGKESNKIEETQVLGVNKNSYSKYINRVNSNQLNINLIKQLIFKLKPKEAKKYGILKLQLMRMRKKIKENKPLNLSNKTRIKLYLLIIKYFHSIGNWF